MFSFYNLFHRPNRNYKFIDGIRAIAILWVIIFHIWLLQIESFPIVSQKITNYTSLIWITRGDLGVDLFFVISGFLIGNLLFKEVIKSKTIRIKRFYLRRILRLMPAYVATMIIGILASEGTPLDNWHMLWANLIYINNYIPNSFMPWTWSLAIEEQFYLVIPFLILTLFPRIKNKLCFFIPLILLAPLLKYYATTFTFDYTWPMKTTFLEEKWEDWFWNYYMLTHFRYGGLLAGVAIAYLHNYKKEAVQRFFKNYVSVDVLTTLSLVLIVIISSVSLGQWSKIESGILYDLPRWFGNFYEAIHRELFYYSVAFIILACLYSSRPLVLLIKKFLSLKFFFPIAQISYSAYLIHEMFMYLYFIETRNLFSWTDLPTWSVMCINGFISLLIVIVFASLMFVFIEQPFQKLKERLT